jgi:SMODS domain-containing protein
MLNAAVQYRTPHNILRVMHDHFLRLKSNLEIDPTLAASIATRHNAIRTYLKNHLPEMKDSKLIGSLQRQTRICPGAGKTLDIDILVILGEFNRWASFGGVTPQAAINTLHAAVNQSDRYSGLDPVQDPPTVTLTYADDIEVELVPAYIDMIGSDPYGNYVGPAGRGYWVVKSGTWEMADYDHEAAFISGQNAASGGYLIPVIKMLKAIKRLYFSDFGSFPLEILAAKIVPTSVSVKRTHQVPIFYPDLLQDFFEYAPSWLDIPIMVPGSKSPVITIDQFTRASLAKTFGTIAGFIGATKNQPNRTNQVEAWRQLFGDHFPASLT